MKIAVIGSGYVGTTAAAIFSASQHHVTAIDIDQKKVDTLNDGRAPFFEAGLDSLIRHSIDKGTLHATTSYESIADADVVFSCVGTPDNPDGSSNLSYVFDSAKKAAEYMKPGAIFVQKSTVPVGTGRAVMEVLSDSNPYVSNPEFLRESSAVYDTLFFDRVVAGGDDEKANQAILNLHKTVQEHSVAIADASGISVDTEQLNIHTGNYISTRLESAELIKVTSNAFLALKISFANNIAQLCDQTNANIDEVMSAVGEDARIGKAFFRAGAGYGGGCFPKDVSGLISSSESFGVAMPIMEAATQINESMSAYIIEKIKKHFNGNLHDMKVGVLGLAFKSNTSDARKSPAIRLANALIKEGAIVTAYDPQAAEEARHDLDAGVTITESSKAALDGARAVVIATDWAEFKEVSNWLPHAKDMEILVDATNCISDSDRRSLPVEYIGIGKA